MLLEVLKRIRGAAKCISHLDDIEAMKERHKNGVKDERNEVMRTSDYAEEHVAGGGGQQSRGMSDRPDVCLRLKLAGNHGVFD